MFVIDKNLMPMVAPATFTPDLSGLIAWLETMPADTAYDYYDCKGACLLGQFYAACGLPWDEGGTTIWLRDEHNFGTMSAEMPRTFGGALTRARAMRR